MRLICLLILFVFTGPLLVQGASPIVLGNDQVEFQFSPQNCALTRIENRKTRRAITFNGTGALWSMQLIDGFRQFPEIFAGGKAKATRRRTANAQILTLTWNNLPLPAGNLTVEVTVTLPDDSGIADWGLRARTSGTPAPWIKEVTFPRIDGVETLGDDYLIYGSYLGRIVRSPGQRLTYEEINHPGRWSMQFVAFYGSRQLDANSLVPPNRGFQVNGFYRGPAADETGLFMAADDGKGYQKSLHLTGTPKESVFAIAPIHYPTFPFWPPESAQRPAQFSYQLPYSIKLGTYSGGAGEAANLYRELVKNREWMKNGPLRAPGNPISPKVLDCAFWAKTYNGANKVVPEILRMRDYLQVPVNTHWVRYGVNRFDDNNLDYFPTMANYREGVRVLREHGVGVAPYVCCAVWDQDTESYRRYGMDRAAALNEFGVPYIWFLAGKQPSSWMNPASPLWRQQYQNVTMKMFGQWGTDGQYLDVLACAGKLCYNTDLHLPHGGTYWADGNRTLLKNLRQAALQVEPEPFLTTEGFSENYIDQMDAFLTLDITRYGWKNRKTTDVFPLFSLIYHDYAVGYGSDCGQQLTPEMQRWEMGLSFTWGVQLCYSANRIDPPGKTVHDRFTRELAQAWHCSGYKFLTGGRGLEIAQVPSAGLIGTAAIGVISAPYRVKLNGYLDFPWEGPSVPASAWRAHDQTVGLTLANISGKSQDVQILFNRQALQSKHDTIWQTWPLPVKKLGKLTAETKLNFTVPADQALILEIRDDSAPATRPLLVSDRKPVLADDKGNFPILPNPSNRLYGCDSAVTRHQDRQLQLLSIQSGKPLKAVPINWARLEGSGGPRQPEVRTFHLLNPTGCELTGNYTALVRCQQDIMSAEIELQTPGRLTAASGCLLLARDANGKLLYSDSGVLELPSGSYRLISYQPQENRQRPDSAALLPSLAEISRNAAEQGQAALTGDDSLSGAVRTAGERLLALGNAVSWLVTGQTATMTNRHDWLIPGRTEQLVFQPSGKGSLTLLNRDRLDQVSLQQGKSEFAVTVNRIEAAANLLRLLYQTNIQAQDCTFRLTSLQYLEVAEPLLAEIAANDNVITKGTGSNEIKNTISIVNTAPVPLPITISAQLPSGWELPKEQNELQFTLNPQAQRRIVLTFRQHNGVETAGKQSVRVFVNYTEHPWTAISEDFFIAERPTRLKPAGSGSVKPSWSGTMRHQARVAVQVGDNREINLNLRPISVGRATSELKWTLFDNRMIPLRRGKLKFNGEQEQILKAAVSAPGLYFVLIEGGFFQIQVNGASHYALSCWEYAPYILHGRQRDRVYFQVKPEAEFFEFNGTDGGPLEPGRVVIKDPDGKVVFDYSGNYSADRWYRIPVSADAAGKIWSMEITPVEDFEVRFRGNVSSWVTPERDVMLTE